jgi:hypothetical protein
MAISKTVITAHGIQVNNAYHRVENLKMFGKDKIKFQLCASVDKNKLSFYADSYECAYDLEGDNPIKQAYTHLKTLSEFAGAVDC